MKTGKSQSLISSVVSNYVTILVCTVPNNGQDALEDRGRVKGNSRWREGKMTLREAWSESISTVDWDRSPTHFAVPLLLQENMFPNTTRLAELHLTASFQSSQSYPWLHLLKKINSVSILILSQYIRYGSLDTVLTIICTSCQIPLKENLKRESCLRTQKHNLSEFAQMQEQNCLIIIKQQKNPPAYMHICAHAQVHTHTHESTQMQPVQKLELYFLKVEM